MRAVPAAVPSPAAKWASAWWASASASSANTIPVRLNRQPSSTPATSTA